MRSRIHLKGHPLHPILVGFPIAFFTGALVFDILGFVYGNENYWRTGSHFEIAGIAAALLAAIPGIVDYISVVPPKSSAKKRASKHGILNIIMLAIYVTAWFYRKGNEVDPYILLGMEALGIILLSISGWLGGTLVHRNQIGIDHRYAGSGKWKEKFIDIDQGRIEIAHSDELKRDQMMLVHLRKNRIVVGRTENGFVAFEDRCTHKGASLADGVMICGRVQCPWHGSQFDCTTGEVKAGPSTEAIKTFLVEVSDEKIYLRI